MRSACSLWIGVTRVYIVAISSAHNNRPIIVGQGPAVLAAGMGLKLFDFLKNFFKFNGVMLGNETVKFFFFGIFL